MIVGCHDRLVMLDALISWNAEDHREGWMSSGKYRLRWRLRIHLKDVNWIHILILPGNSSDLLAKLLVSQVGPLGDGPSHSSRGSGL